MRTFRKQGTSRRADKGWLGRDGWRALVACLCLGSLCFLGIHVGGDSLLSTRANPAKVSLADDDLTTGSIVVVPRFGDDCRQRLIDNATWRIWDVGTVDCRVALAKNSSTRPKQWSSSRVDVIRGGFWKK